MARRTGRFLKDKVKRPLMLPSIQFWTNLKSCIERNVYQTQAPVRLNMNNIAWGNRKCQKWRKKDEDAEWRCCAWIKQIPQCSDRNVLLWFCSRLISHDLHLLVNFEEISFHILSHLCYLTFLTFSVSWNWPLGGSVVDAGASGWARVCLPVIPRTSSVWSLHVLQGPGWIPSSIILSLSCQISNLRFMILGRNWSFRMPDLIYIFRIKLQ